MNAKEHLEEVHKAQALHIADVVRCLLDDPMGDKQDKKYVKEVLSGYLQEVIDKDGNLAHGLVVALEVYLGK